MKKIVALILALVLCLCSAAAFAEDIPEINWDTDMAPYLEALGLSGEFYNLDPVGLKIWVPSDMSAIELDDEFTEAGYIAYFISEDQTHGAGVQFLYTEDYTTLEDYYNLLLTLEGVSRVDYNTINGIPFISYLYDDGNQVNACATCSPADNYVIEIPCAPFSEDNEWYGAFLAMLSSIQPMD